MELETILIAIALGYFIAGQSALLKTMSEPIHNRPIMMMRPNLIKKAYWMAFWPIHTYLEVFYIHMPHKARARIYASLTIPVMLLGFSILSGVIIYPHYVIENSLLAIIASVVLYAISLFVLTPIIALVSTFLIMALASLILLFFPKQEDD